MSPTIEQALQAFIAAWEEGRRPRLDDYVERVPPADQAALANAIAGFMAYAPTPEYDATQMAEIRAEPNLVAVREQLASLPPLPQLIRKERERAGLSLRALAIAVAQTVGLGGREERIEGYLGRLERGELDTRRLTRRLIGALSGALGADAARLALAPPSPAAGALFRAKTSAPPPPAAVQKRLEAVADAILGATPEQRDEVDELFLGG